MPWRWWLRRPRVTGPTTGSRLLAAVQAQQAEVDRLAGQLTDSRDAFTAAFTQALKGEQ